MKLIDLLVQELPKRGGWPKDAEFAHFNGVQIGFYMGNRATFYPPWTIGLSASPLDDKVTSEQYEAALAASQKVEWDGVGLPPVGCECEVAQPGQIIWDTFKVIAVESGTVFGFFNNGASGAALTEDCWSFRHIRSEADKKRDAFIAAVLDDMRTIPCDLELRDEVAVIYDAIAAGKIPGVKLED